MTKDPVCGMEVDEKKAPTSTYRGKQYAFCGEDCKRTFEQDPKKFTASGQTAKAGKA